LPQAGLLHVPGECPDREVIQISSADSPRLQACTIATRSYVPFARVLAESFRQHHPGAEFTVVLVDDRERKTLRDEMFDLLHIGDVDLGPGELHRMAASYNVIEFSTAVKPWVLRHLRSAGGVTMYLDPDIEFFAPIWDVVELAAERNIVLTPHVLRAVTRDGLRPSEADILMSGVYNLGFLALGPNADPMLDWWAERVRRHAIIDPSKMLFTDQRWMDFVPGIFESLVLRDPTVNVAYWNVDQRDLHRRDGVWLVEDERPLRFFHFSGFDPGHPGILSRHQLGQPRLAATDSVHLGDLCREYAARLCALDPSGAQRRLQYGWTRTSAGISLNDATRRRYWEDLVRAEKDDLPLPPDLFDEQRAHEAKSWLAVARGSLPRRMSEEAIDAANAFLQRHPRLRTALVPTGSGRHRLARALTGSSDESPMQILGAGFRSLSPIRTRAQPHLADAEVGEIGRNWEGFARLDPMWAILSKPGTKGNRWEASDFFASGEAEFDTVISTLQRLGLPTTGRRALDFGCGIGRLTQAMCSRFELVTGVDVSPKMIELARAANRFDGRCTYVVNDRADLAVFADGHFDLVYCSRVLQHLGAKLARSYIAEFVRVVDRSGVGVFQIPARPAVGSQTGAECSVDNTMFSASYRAVDPPASAPAGSLIRVNVEVRNTAPVSWYPREAGQGYVRLGATWLDAHMGSRVGEETERADIAEEIRPSEAGVLELAVLAPARPGRYLLKVGLLCELVATFEAHGVAPLLLPIELEASEGTQPADGSSDLQLPLVPKMRMEGIQRVEIEDLLSACGARLVDAQPDDLAGDDWESWTYVFVRP
jgi:SAM-dependent methyltransferase